MSMKKLKIYQCGLPCCSLTSQVSFLCRSLDFEQVANFQNTRQDSSTLVEHLPDGACDIPEQVIQSSITEHEVKKAALLAIKQEAENRKASEQAARGAQEAAEEAEEKAMEAKAVAFYQ